MLTSRLSSLSFRTWLILGTGIWSLILVTVTGTLINRVTASSDAAVTEVNLNDRLDRASFRFQQLLQAAELSIRSTARFTPASATPSEAVWRDILQRSIPVLEQRPELTRLGYSSATTGEYGFLWREESGRLLLHLATRQPDGTLRQRRYSAPGFGSLELIETLPAGTPLESFPLPSSGAPAEEAESFYWSTVHHLRGISPAIGVTCVLPAPLNGDGIVPGYWWAEYDLTQLHRFTVAVQEETGLRISIFDHQRNPPLWVGHHNRAAIAGLPSISALADLPASDAILNPILHDSERSPAASPSPVTSAQMGQQLWFARQQYLPAPYDRWSIIGATPGSGEAATNGITSTPLYLGIAVGGSVMSILLAWLIARLLSRPIESLSASVETFATTGVIDITDTPAPREIQDLRLGLREQGRNLLNRQKQLAEINANLQRQVDQRLSHEATLTAIFDNTPFDIWTTDANGTYTYQNRLAQDLHGDVIGKRVDEIEDEASLVQDRIERTRRVLAGEIMSADTVEDTPRGRRYFHVVEAPILREGEVVGTLGVKIDLTEQRRAEAALRDSQRRISRHLENTPLGVVEFDEKFRIRSWNASAEAIFGWKAEEAIGRLGSMIVAPADQDQVTATWRTLLATPEGSRNFNQNLTKDGRIIDCEWYNTPIVDPEGKIVGVSSLVLDVSDRLMAERLFRDSEERFQRVFHLSPAPQVIASYPDGRIIDVNQAWLTTFGYNREQIINRNGLELNLWSDPADRQRLLRTLDSTGSFPPQTLQMRDHAGQDRTVLFSAARARLSDSECVVISETDVSERIATEKALRENRQLLETLVAQLPGLSFRCLIDENWTMVWVNRGAMNLTGYPPEDFLESRISFNDLILPAHRESARTIVEGALLKPLGQRRYSLEYQIKHRDGRILWFWEQGEIIRNPHTLIDEIVGFISDITERKQAETQLRELNETLELRVAARTADLESANEKLTELDRLKTEFLGTMSHELRTPLNSIIGFSSILARGMVGPLSPEQHKQIGMVNQSAKNLLELINDLLDVSRIDSGRMEMLREEVDIPALLAEVEKDLTPRVKPERMTYVTTLADDLPVIVSDRRRLHQILFNLAGNALKFTPGPAGRVEVSARRSADGGVIIAVSDNGIGIKAEHLPQLFEAFRQIDGSARRVYDGVGLGLNLVRKLTAKLGGHISVESEFGRGSCFTVTLPPASPGGSN